MIGPTYPVQFSVDYPARPLDRSTTALPAVLPVMSSACMTGTPAEVRSSELVRDAYLGKAAVA